MGLMFLRSPEDQRRLIQRTADILCRAATVYVPCGTTSLERCDDGIGLSIASEYEDEGQNHYFDAFKDTQYAMLAHGDGAKQA